MKRSLHFWLSVWALLAIQAVGTGQTPSRDRPIRSNRVYVDFGIEPDYVTKLQERLKQESDLGPLKDLVKQVLADPKLLTLDPSKFKEMKFDEKPELRKAVEDWARNDRSLQESLRNWIKNHPPDPKNPEEKQLQQQLQRILERTAQGEPGDEGPLPIEARNRGTQSRPQEDPLAKFMKVAERTELRKWLDDSPAWQRAFEDLRGSLEQPGLQGAQAGDWTSKLLAPEGGAWKIADGTLDRLRNLPKPNFDRLPWPRNFSGIGNIPMPNVDSPGMPSVGGPSLPSLSTGASWILLILIVAVVGWRLLRWKGHRKHPAAPHSEFGPWPVPPEVVATNADLIRAFDYLALRTLGLPVKSWNHLAIANRWIQHAPDCAEAAAALAQVYEIARYTSGPDELPAATRERVQLALTQLAEAF